MQEKSRESHANLRDKKQEVGAQSPEPPVLEYELVARPAGFEPTIPWFVVGEVRVSTCFCYLFAARPPGLRLLFTVLYSESLKSPYRTDHVMSRHPSDSAWYSGLFAPDIGQSDLHLGHERWRDDFSLVRRK